MASLASLAAAVALAESGQAFLGAVAAVVVALAVEPTVMLRMDYRLLASIALMLVDFRVLGTLVSPLVSGLGTFNPVAVTVVAALLGQAVSNVPATVLLVDRVRWRLSLA